MATRTSLKDVARAAGVSHMTVSRVVRGERTVQAATAERVRRFLRKLRYRPDPALSALAAYRTRRRSPGAGNVLAFLEAESMPYGDLVKSGAREEALRLGYALHAFPLPASPAGQRQLSRQLFHRGVRGLMVSPPSRPLRLEGWDWDEFAVVAMGALRHEPALHAVAMDYFHGLLTAHEGLRRMGHRRIGLLVQEDLEARTGHLWLGAYRTAPGPALRPFLFDAEAKPGRALDAWLRRERPDAVLTIHRKWHARLARAGVACAYLNDMEPHPGAPLIRLDPRTIGREATQLTHQLVQRREWGHPTLPKTILLRGEWHPTGDLCESPSFQVPSS
jgi:DNA-binding LacI/PurR family transcriptional regulator